MTSVISLPHLFRRRSNESVRWTTAREGADA